MPSVDLKDITKHFGRVRALEGINLKIKDGEYVALLGPSGCGKTTLINCITGIVNPTRGTILIDGKDVQHLSIEKRDFGMVFQSIALFPHMTVEQNVSYAPFVDDLSHEEQIEISEEMLKLVDLLEQKQLKPRQQSGGAQQKTSVARALATKDKLLILDEPISALDYKVRVSLRYDLRRLVKELGLTAIHITHDQEEAMSIADRIVILRAGEIVEIGTPQQLYETPQTLFTMNFVGESNFLEGIVVQENSENICEIEFRNRHKIVLKGIKNTFKEGDSLVVTFRPENLIIDSHKQENTLEGIILRKQFSRGFMRYEAKLLTEDSIIIDSNKNLDIGEKIFISLEPSKTRLFQAPEFGLMKVLALE
ncbi:MAG: ABC transporter ATP-binding protein [Candidatus Hodarchaeales archaeon]